MTEPVIPHGMALAGSRCPPGRRDTGGSRVESRAPGDRVVQREVPDGRDAGTEEVGEQVVHAKLIVEPGEDTPVDDEPANVDWNIGHRPVENPAAGVIVPRPDLIEEERDGHRNEDGDG